MPNTEATKIAVLEKEHEQMSIDITEIKSDIKEIKAMLTTNFVTQVEFERNRDTTQLALEQAKKSTTIKMLVTVLVTSIITSLIAFFFHEIISGV